MQLRINASTDDANMRIYIESTHTHTHTHTHLYIQTKITIHLYTQGTSGGVMVNKLD